VRRLFALDHNFPDPIVAVLAGYQNDAELVRIDRIDGRLADLQDWELLLALHHHERPWDGLITTDTSMVSQAPELATLLQTKLTLIVAKEAGHNPVKASGLLFAHLGGICKRTSPDIAQAWIISAVSRPPDDPWELLKRHAEHNNRSVQDVWKEHQLSPEELTRDPLAE
jgi:hypothetical protein